MPSITLTTEQEDILAAARENSGHLIIDAKAGSGKTATLIQMLPLLKGTTALQAFNRAIADELKQRVGQLGILVAANTQVSTVHSAGLAAFRQSGAKPQTLSGKLSFMLKDAIASYRSDDPIHRNTRLVTKLTGFAKQSGFGVTSISSKDHFPSITDTDAWLDLALHHNLDLELEAGFTVEQLVEEAQDLLKASNARVNSIDFDDMIYLPLLLNMNLKQYDNVMLDEAQDINATRRELAFRSLRPNGRMIAVGDPHQAIYGFTGASVDSLNDIRRRCEPDVQTFPLSICWRCDEAIISAAQKIVPTIKARPNAPAGLVDRIAFRDAGSDDPHNPREAQDFLALPRPGDAILCRLNRPNVATALGLIRRGTAAKIEGRDLGKKLLDHVRKATDLYAHQPLADTQQDLQLYKETETEKLLRKNRESAIPLLEDEVDAASLLIDRVLESKGHAATFVQLEALAQDLFGDDVSSAAVVTLSSVHKAKGREWNHVFLLGKSDYMPFWRAEEGWQLEQEYNLIYVAETRARKHLTYVHGVQAALDKGAHREAALTIPQYKEQASC